MGKKNPPRGGFLVTYQEFLLLELRLGPQGLAFRHLLLGLRLELQEQRLVPLEQRLVQLEQRLARLE